MDENWYSFLQDGVDVTFDLVGTSAEHHYTHRNEQASGGQRTVRAKLLVGADGIRSAVRRIMAGKWLYHSLRERAGC